MKKSYKPLGNSGFDWGDWQKYHRTLCRNLLEDQDLD